MKIIGFKIQNFKGLKDITVGKLSADDKNEPLTKLVAFIGENGAGKTSILEAFNFLLDIFTWGSSSIPRAINNRGGFINLYTQNALTPLCIRVCFGNKNNEFYIYELTISVEKIDNILTPVAHETLVNGTDNTEVDQPNRFLGKPLGDTLFKRTTLKCIDNPDFNLYFSRLNQLVTTYRQDIINGLQIFITTHNPILLDHLDPEEVWLLKKDKNGLISAIHVSDILHIKHMVNEGLILGGLWYSDYFSEEADIE